MPDPENNFKPCPKCKEHTHWKELNNKEQWELSERPKTFRLSEEVWDKWEDLCHGCLWELEERIPPNSVRFAKED